MALENGNVRVRGTKRKIQEVSTTNFNGLNTRSNLQEDNEQEIECKSLSHVQNEMLPRLQ